MGIKGLKPLLRSYGVHEYTVPLSQMSGKTIAVDGTFLLHKYKNCHSVPWHYLTLPLEPEAEECQGPLYL
ncbi:putative DNA repair protein RAD2 [Frog virus 3]|uniref:Putative DNA repair protein RAD2 n=1 Tax=Frog virus 3 TaxID=10493 RepID=A0A5B8P313_FRG3V|nr:putative DNA repair protein RAD2 [Frog virus 3]